LFMNTVLLYEGSSDNKKISIDKWRLFALNKRRFLLVDKPREFRQQKDNPS
jgi:hypothetical protein